MPEPIPVVADRHSWSEPTSERFDLADDSVVLTPPRGEIRMSQIKLQNIGNKRVTGRNIVVRFRSGQTQNIPVAARLEHSEETATVNLEGGQRRIENVTAQLEPHRRPGRAELALLTNQRPGATDNSVPANIDRDASRGWDFLGQQEVAFLVDHDVININQSEDWYRNRRYRTLRFIAGRNDVHMMKVRLVDMNGATEEFPIDRMMPAGSELPLELRGERRFIKQIHMTYRSRPSFAGQATMKVYGEPIRR